MVTLIAQEKLDMNHELKVWLVNPVPGLGTSCAGLENKNPALNLYSVVGKLACSN